MPASFSHIANVYDQDFTHTSIGVKQREQVHKAVLPYLNKDQDLLELNGGTGEDALFLAKYCKSVLTTDISPEMVDIAKSKTSHLQNVKTEVLDINSLKPVSNKKFDLVFSNFGGLNCLSPKEIHEFLVNVNGLLKNNGLFIAVIMGRKTLWERFYFTLKKDYVNAKRRRSEAAIKTNIDGKKVSTWYYSPKQIVEMLPKQLKSENSKPIGLFVPPSYLQAFFTNKKWLLSVFHFLDGFIINRWSDYADHYCIFLRRTG